MANPAANPREPQKHAAEESNTRPQAAGVDLFVSEDINHSARRAAPGLEAC